jgi:hypothetical protein
LPAIGFDDQSVLDACEVGDEGTDRVLPSELAAGEALGTEEVPEQLLGIGHVAPQVAGHQVRHAAGMAGKYRGEVDAPSPGALRRPLPHAGEVY